ncbi:MAG: two-component histidine kinase [Gemmatimonadetes bacterium]|nr:two-component histidine kinase [Gemmatimonadota bacterium]
MPGSRRRPAWSAITGVAVATALVAAALGTWLLVGRILPFTFFLAAVALSSWFRGTRVGLVALLLSIVVIDYVLGAIPNSLGMSVADMPRIVTFALSALLVLWLTAARRSAEEALRRARDELDERVRERTASLAATNEQLYAEIEERKRSERRLASAALRLAHTRRRARERVLEARFAAVLEERTRLAREIHDTLLQGFTGVSFQLMAAMARLGGPAEYRASLDEVLALAQKTLADARQAVWDMRPPALEDDEFSTAFRAALERTTSGAALTLDYVARGIPRPLDPNVETVLFRVAQEAVSNVLKHAAARTVRVVLTYGRRSVRLSIADDGSGFIVHPDLHSYAGHWGLLGMRERASRLRGRLAVQSTPGEGTKIVLHVPARTTTAGSRIASAAPARPEQLTGPREPLV